LTRDAIGDDRHVLDLAPLGAEQRAQLLGVAAVRKVADINLRSHFQLQSLQSDSRCDNRTRFERPKRARYETAEPAFPLSIAGAPITCKLPTPSCRRASKRGGCAKVWYPPGHDPSLHATLLRCPLVQRAQARDMARG